MQRRKMTNPLDKKWEFETNQGYLADAFIQVLNVFHISPEDTYIPSYLDMSQIEFRTTRKKRLQIEYVFRRYAGQSSTEGSDWYAIS